MADIINLEARLISGPRHPISVYEVPNAGMVVLQDVINATWNLALDKSGAATLKATDVASNIDSLLATPGNLHVTSGSVAIPTVTAPNVNIPSSIDTSSIMATFDSKYQELADYLVGKYTAFLSTHFAAEPAVYTAGESLIAAMLANPSGGLPATVQAQMLADDHARATAEANRASDTLMATFAARRFPLPPGAMSSGIMQIQQKSQDLMAESSRKVTIASVENMKFAIEKAINLRTVAIGAAGDFVKSIASGPDVASRVLGIGYDAQSKLISAAAGFYGADTNAKEMIAKVSQFNDTLADDAATENQVADMGLIDTKVKALLADLQSTMQQATALFNNLHASVGLSTNSGTSISTTGQV